MTAVVDSGPLISLAAVGQVDRLREQCGEILIVPAVEREVIAEGQGRAGEAELRAALTAGWARRVLPPDQALVARLRRPALALADSEVLACAIAHGRVLLVAADAPLRRLALEEHLPLVGTIGVLVRARLDGHSCAKAPPRSARRLGLPPRSQRPRLSRRPRSRRRATVGNRSGHRRSLTEEHRLSRGDHRSPVRSVTRNRSASTR